MKESSQVGPPRSPGRFFLWCYLASVPFWFLGLLVPDLPLPIDLPISALGVVVPGGVATVLTWRETRLDGIKRLYGHWLGARGWIHWPWLLVAAVFAPLVMMCSYSILWSQNVALPPVHITSAEVVLFSTAFFPGAVAEEIGWQAYGFEGLRGRMRVPNAALLTGANWALWHVVPFFQTHHSGLWILWQCLTAVTARMVIVWIYVRGGGLLGAVIFHAMSNIAEFLFPEHGSHYDPFLNLVLTGLVVAVIFAAKGFRAPVRPDAVITARGAVDR